MRYFERRFYQRLIEDRMDFPGGTATYGEYVTMVTRESTAGGYGGL